MMMMMKRCNLHYYFLLLSPFEGESCPCCVDAMKRYNGLIMGTILAQLGSFSRDVLVKRRRRVFRSIVNSIMENRYVISLYESVL